MAWGDASNGFQFSTLAAGSSSWSTPGSENVPASGQVDVVDLATEVGTNRIAGMFLDFDPSTERLGLATWDGTSWVDGVQADGQIRDVTVSGDVAGGVAWLGSSGTAVCVYSDNQTGALDWATWTSGGGWTIETDFAISGKGFTESVQLDSFTTKNEILVVLSDSNSDLFALIYDGSNWTITNSGAALELTLSSISAAPFSFSVQE